MKKISFNKRYIIEFIILAILGSVFHFIFEWSRNNNLVALISPVNESVWEHLKLAVFTTILVLLIEKYFMKIDIKNFYTSLLLRVLIPIVVIPSVFYLYSSILGKEILVVDILTLYFTLILGQIVESILSKKNISKNTEKVSAILVAIISVIFFIVTFYPPHMEIFRDPEKNVYGIVKK